MTKERQEDCVALSKESRSSRALLIVPWPTSRQRHLRPQDSFNEDPHKKTCQRETQRLKAEGMKEALDSHGAGEAEVAIGNTTYAAIEEAHCCGVKTIRRPNCYESSDFHQVKQNIAADNRTQGVMEKSQQELKRVRCCNKKSHSLVQIVAS
ncbi:hypothetical protein Bbelb_048890 [Branchiostoma belcheri]|nr:hypothetical protein Bbelb_048890 [Branchiostoma belcheri]